MLPRPAFFENGVNGVAELAGDRSDGREMVLAPGTERLVILREDRVAKGRPGGGQPDGPTKIWRAPFGDFLPGPGKFAGLGDPHIQSGKGDQLVGRVKAVDVADLAQDNSAQRIPDPGDGSDIAAGLLQQGGYLPLQFRDLSLQKFKLLDELTDLKRKGIFSKTYSKGIGSGRFHLLCFLSAKPSMTGFFQ